ncbi:hypothetical protein PENTCL1PPCAC_2066, partial [Pristionchus entomophagus]
MDSVLACSIEYKGIFSQVWFCTFSHSRIYFLLFLLFLYFLMLATISHFRFIILNHISSPIFRSSVIESWNENSSDSFDCSTLILILSRYSFCWYRHSTTLLLNHRCISHCSTSNLRNSTNGSNRNTTCIHRYRTRLIHGGSDSIHCCSALFSNSTFSSHFRSTRIRTISIFFFISIPSIRLIIRDFLLNHFEHSATNRPHSA